MCVSASFDFEPLKKLSMRPTVVMPTLSIMVTQPLPSNQSFIAFKKAISICNGPILTATSLYSSGSNHYTCFATA